jgi:hypothetical protein
MENLPIYIPILFILATAITAGLLIKASGRSPKTIWIILVWLALQAVLGLTGFYKITDTIPPRFALLIMPPLVLISVLFVTTKGRTFIDRLDLKTLTLLHSVRILVETVLFFLCAQQLVPQLMTFEGMNFDIISGITAPIIFYFGFVKGNLNRKVLMGWNILCLGLLLNVVIRAILSVPTPFQQFAFDQPAVAVLYFPFNWLPSFVVPVVLFSHLVAFRQLSKK